MPHGPLYRLPAAGPRNGAAPGPMKVPTERLRTFLGITDVRVIRGQQRLAVVDTTLAA